MIRQLPLRWLAGLLLGISIPAAECQPFGEGIRVQVGAVAEFSGRLNLDRGPEDGLEVLASLRGEKLHESLVELDTRDAPRVLAALLLVFGAAAPAATRVTVVWDGVAHPAESLVRDRTTDAGLAVEPARWRGVVEADYQQPDGAGGTVVRRLPVLGRAGTVCAIVDEEGGAPLQLAVPDPADDRRYEANSRLMPPIGTPVVVRVERLPALP